MSAPNAHTVNQYYLDKVMDVAERMSFEVIVDILDVRGMKLVAKGARVTRALQEKLIVHKLRRPFETSIGTAGAVDGSAVVRMAARIIDTSAPVAGIVRATSTGGPSPLSILSGLEFGHAMSMMLTISDRAGAQALEHAVLVSLLSICMAKKLRLGENEQKVAGLAGLLHDIGELYIDPSFLARGKRLLPHEWSHVVVHPRIGQMLIDELESYPAAVGRAVAEHHERFDGTGYPRQIAGSQISAPGQAVAVAEMIAGLLLKDHPLERAELALKIIPGEHAHDLLSAISGALRLSHADDHEQGGRAQAGESVERLFWRISSILETGKVLLDGPAAKSHKTRELLTITMARVKNIQRAFISTGLDVYLRPQPGFGAGTDGSLLFEKEVASEEIQWRLRDIARDLALHTTTPDEKVVLAVLVRMLDDDRCGAETRSIEPKQSKLFKPQPASQVSVRRFGA